MTHTNMSKNMEDFRHDGCCLIPQLISSDCRKLLSILLEIDELNGKKETGDQVIGSREVYNSLNTTILNQLLLPKVKEYSNAPQLFSTYSFYRKYFHGQELEKHTDRPECEISLSLCVDMEDDKNPWSIFVENPHLATTFEAKPQIGDAILYFGNLPHWREPTTQKWLKQLFIHYSSDPRLEFDNIRGDKPREEILMKHFIRYLTETR